MFICKRKKEIYMVFDAIEARVIFASNDFLNSLSRYKDNVMLDARGAEIGAKNTAELSRIIDNATENDLPKKLVLILNNTTTLFVYSGFLKNHRKMLNIKSLSLDLSYCKYLIPTDVCKLFDNFLNYFTGNELSLDLSGLTIIKNDSAVYRSLKNLLSMLAASGTNVFTIKLNRTRLSSDDTLKLIQILSAGEFKYLNIEVGANGLGDAFIEGLAALNKSAISSLSNLTISIKGNRVTNAGAKILIDTLAAGCYNFQFNLNLCLNKLSPEAQKELDLLLIANNMFSNFINCNLALSTHLPEDLRLYVYRILIHDQDLPIKFGNLSTDEKNLLQKTLKNKVEHLILNSKAPAQHQQKGSVNLRT